LIEGQELTLEVFLDVLILLLLPLLHLNNTLHLKLLLDFLGILSAVFSKAIFTLFGMLLHLGSNFLKFGLQFLDVRVV
jgi:hypothetical protein